MSESRQYFMTIALSLEIESGTSAIYKTTWFDEADWSISIIPSECPGDSSLSWYHNIPKALSRADKMKNIRKKTLAVLTSFVWRY